MVMVNGDGAQRVSRSILRALLIFQFELERGQCSHPAMARSIQVRGGQDVGEWVVISFHQKWSIDQILPKMLHEAPLQC